MARSTEIPGRRMWDAREMKTLRHFAGRRSAATIASQLGRTEAAIRNKASKEGIYFTEHRGGRSPGRPSRAAAVSIRKAVGRRARSNPRLH